MDPDRVWRATTTSSATTQAPTGTNPIPRLTALTPQNQPERPLLRGNQCCGVEKCQVRTAEGQRNHIRLSLQAFLRLEAHRLSAGVSWYESKANIIRPALRDYLAYPKYTLHPTA